MLSCLNAYIAAHYRTYMKPVYRFFAALLLAVFAFNTARAQSADVEFEGLKEINGTKLYCKVIGKGQPLIIIHGGPTMSHDYLLPHLLPLSKQFKLIFFDQRGTGRSVLPDSNEMSHQAMIEDINGVMDAFKLDSANILAHSWGAKLAVLYAMANPARVKKMVLSNPIIMSHEFDSLQNVHISAKKTAADREKMRELSHDEGFRNGNREIIRQMMVLNFRSGFYDTANVEKLKLVIPENFIQSSMLTMKGLNSDFRNYDKDYFPLMNEVKKPVLIMHGMADDIILKADEKMQRSLGNAKLERFNKSGHFPFIEENDKFTKTVSEFLLGTVK